MRKLLFVLFLAIGCVAQTTPNLGLNLPASGGDDGTWGTLLNTNFTALDSFLSGGTPLPSNLSVVGEITVGSCSGCGSGSLPATVVYVTPGASQSAIQAILSAATAGEEIWFTGTYTACGLTLGTSYVRLRGLATGGTILECATASSPVLTISGGNGVDISGIDFKHITNTPTCPGGNGTSTCGDGLQIAGGTYGTKIHDIQFDFNYNGIALGYTSYGEFSNSRGEYNQNHGVAFVMSSSHPVMQWQVDRVLSQQNLGNGFDMTCPASFTSVQTAGPHLTGWTNTYGNAGYGYNFSCSAAATSGISDVFIGNIFASQNNNSGIHVDVGPNGGRNFILTGFYSEQAGTYTGNAGFAQAAQEATDAGYGIEITSACDNTPAPVITGGIVWQNSYSGIIASCPGTAIDNVSSDDNGLDGASAQTEAFLTINASNVSVHGGYHKEETYGVYLESGDTPHVNDVVCDSTISTADCVYVASAPSNGFQQQVGQVKFLTGSGTPTMNCSVGWEYNNTSASSASTAKYICAPANTWTAITVP
jgi:hypothetical protein